MSEWTAIPDPARDGSWVVQAKARGERAGLMVWLGYGLTEADARLIAAAPDLLEAMKELADLQRFSRGFSNGVESNGIEEADFWHSQTMERVHAAIAKAERAS